MIVIPTSEGISQATTRTVVHASLVVHLRLDFILTAIMFVGRLIGYFYETNN